MRESWRRSVSASRLKNGFSSIDCRPGCASSICSSSVVPERGKPTMKTGELRASGAVNFGQFAIFLGGYVAAPRSAVRRVGVELLGRDAPDLVDLDRVRGLERVHRAIGLAELVVDLRRGENNTVRLRPGAAPRFRGSRVRARRSPAAQGDRRAHMVDRALRRRRRSTRPAATVSSSTVSASSMRFMRSYTLARRMRASEIAGRGAHEILEQQLRGRAVAQQQQLRRESSICSLGSLSGIHCRHGLSRAFRRDRNPGNASRRPRRGCAPRGDSDRASTASRSFSRAARKSCRCISRRPRLRCGAGIARVETDRFGVGALGFVAPADFAQHGAVVRPVRAVRGRELASGARTRRRLRRALRW